ncbi:MAG: hypothetical protein OEX00_11650, partial [Gammaproteobacteria bacterium]|nr:hypothetical protein [Gammaproteobacteria bacterium]
YRHVELETGVRAVTLELDGPDHFDVSDLERKDVVVPPLLTKNKIVTIYRSGMLATIDLPE